MKYRDLLDFCRLMIDTNVDEGILSSHHVSPDGYIEKVLTKVLEAVRLKRDFDYHEYLEKLTDGKSEEPTKRTIN